MQSAKRPKKVGTWQAVGGLVAHFRKKAGLTQEQFAAVAKVHIDTLRSIEQGRLALQDDRAIQFDELLGTGGVLFALVEKLPVRERMPAFAQGLADIEETAVSILSYETQMIPGLLQTEDYCRASFASRFPRFEDETEEQWVSSRMERQKIWRRKQPPFGHFILEESILRTALGGPDVMREQVRKVREASDLVHIGIQIMPVGRVPHAGLAGPMLLLETPAHEHAVYLEVQRASFLVDDPHEVSVYQLKYGMLRSQALSPDESACLLDRLLGE
ncbi:helix-turn-helix domain-containing protein [Streptomyces sp. NBC_01239]|uniref:helix-turn-helix domain-containing protein n=1 Tax=Streptomyces sp. NBC_01239 TaxID=2903792 RepID=UPI0022563742|nr:helix-turn-helix transcriptional regulator [Streptomyces sp. NBC_01239]MCX4814095.1 helix-turn-helix domain-containing protein [Streptomyces sp. NBC_01239]